MRARKPPLVSCDKLVSIMSPDDDDLSFDEGVKNAYAKRCDGLGVSCNVVPRGDSTGCGISPIAGARVLLRALILLCRP
jgi:hypothetical protein